MGLFINDSACVPTPCDSVSLIENARRLAKEKKKKLGGKKLRSMITQSYQPTSNQSSVLISGAHNDSIQILENVREENLKSPEND